MVISVEEEQVEVVGSSLIEERTYRSSGMVKYFRKLKKKKNCYAGGKRQLDKIF